MLSELKPDALTEFRFKSLGLRITDTTVAKTTDKILNGWVKDTLLQALYEKRKVGRHFGKEVFSLLKDCIILGDDGRSFDIQRLKAFNRKRLISYKNSINKALAAFCVMLIRYLNGETYLTTTGTNQQYKDDQLRLAFEILILFKQIEPDQIQSSPEDYIRSLIKNVDKIQDIVNKRYQ